ANTLAEAEEMLKAAQDHGCVHMICHNYRRAPAVSLARQLIESGQLGNIYHYRATYLQDWLRNPDFPTRWRLNKSEAGSGALGDLFSHSVDLARYLVGELAELSAMLKTFVDKRPVRNSDVMAEVDVDDAALALVKFRNGAIGSIEATRYASGRKNFNRFEINGSKGSVAFNLERMNELEVYLDSDPEATRGFRRVLVTESSHPFIKAWWPPGHIIGYEHTFTHTVFDLLEAIADDKMPKPDFTDGLNNQRVLHAIETASARRKWVTV